MRTERILLGIGLTAVLLFGCLLANFYLHLPTQWQPGTNLGGDLKQFYAAGQMLKREDYHVLYRDYHFGRELYRWFDRKAFDRDEKLERFNFRYSPLYAWISEKMLPLPYILWVKGWFWFSIACTVAASLLLLNGLPRLGKMTASCWLLLLSFAPLTYTLGLEQNACLTFLILCASCYLLRNNQALAAGLVFSCAFYKPQFALCGLLLMLLTGHKRFCAGLILGSALWTALSLFLCGWHAHVDWLHSLWEILRGRQSDEMTTNIAWKGFALTALPGGWQNAGMLLSYLFALAALVWFVWRLNKLQSLKSWSADLTLALAVVYWLIFTPHVKSYELVLGLVWCIYFLRLPLPRRAVLFWTAFFWSCGLLALTARCWQVSLVAAPLTLWLVLTVERCMQTLGGSPSAAATDRRANS